jgi:hypothetical protein
VDEIEVGFEDFHCPYLKYSSEARPQTEEMYG